LEKNNPQAAQEIEKPTQSPMVKDLNVIPSIPQPKRDPLGNLSKKLTKGIESMDFKMRECNCRGDRGEGKCQYGDIYTGSQLSSSRSLVR
jgi:hypothetical protein